MIMLKRWARTRLWELLEEKIVHFAVCIEALE